MFLAWIIAPALAGLFASVIFLITKYAVLLRQNPVMRGLFLVPASSAVTASLIAMLLVWKGGSYEVNLTDSQIPMVIIFVGIGFGLLVATLFVPWLYRVVIKEDWQLRWYHMYQGPVLLRRGPVPPPPGGYTGPVQDYYAGHATREDVAAQRSDLESRDSNADHSGKSDSILPIPQEGRSLVGPRPEGVWYSRQLMFWYLKWAIFHGVDQDVVGHQSSPGAGDALAKNLDDMHARAVRYDNRAEYLYSFLQIMIAATSSFTHGANDVSKFVTPPSSSARLSSRHSSAIGPYATIFQIWRDGRLPSNDEAEVPTWILYVAEQILSTLSVQLTVLVSLAVPALSSVFGLMATTSCGT